MDSKRNYMCEICFEFSEDTLFISNWAMLLNVDIALNFIHKKYIGKRICKKCFKKLFNI